jgi:hypothetical protein
MCYPIIIPIAMAAVSAAASAYGVVQQNKAMKLQAEEASKAEGLDLSRLTARSEEESDAAAQEKLQRELQTQRERGRIRVAQGEAGVTGPTTLRVLSSSLRQGAMDVSVIEANRLAKIEQLQYDRMGVSAKAESRRAGAQAGFVSPGLAALQITGSAAEGYAAGSSLTAGLGSGAGTKKKPSVQTNSRRK